MDIIPFLILFFQGLKDQILVISACTITHIAIKYMSKGDKIVPKVAVFFIMMTGP